jgi:type II secretory pathway pseudopilin PulG
MRTRTQTSRKAASLVEMLVVIGIIMLLLAMLLSVVGGAVRAARSLRGQAGPPPVTLPRM